MQVREYAYQFPEILVGNNGKDSRLGVGILENYCIVLVKSGGVSIGFS